MATASVHRPELPTTPVLDRIEAELERLKVLRPHLATSIERAERLLIGQLSVPAGVRPIKARANGHIHSYEVRSGSSLKRSYTVDRESWTCDCPATKTCYHVIGVWVLERALLSAHASPPSANGGEGGRCSGCGSRHPYGELIEVTEENSAFTLSVFVGERYCHSCARRHGVL